MPRKVSDLIQDLRGAGFGQVSGAGKGSHRKFTHPSGYSQRKRRR
jgi:predicted RNA binding protein YcfA (HicA-like mRNA interferase family)